MVISYSLLVSICVMTPTALALAISDATWTAFFISLPASIAATATLIVSVKSAKQVQKIEVATNSMKDALVKATLDEALARGVKQGVLEQKAAHGEQIVAKAEGVAQEQVKQGEILLAKTQAKTEKKVEEL